MTFSSPRRPPGAAASPNGTAVFVQYRSTTIVRRLIRDSLLER